MPDYPKELLEAMKAVGQQEAAMTIQQAVAWEHNSVKYYVIGIEFSKSRPDKFYEVVVAENDEGRRWVSCNCRGFTTAKRHKGKKQWERYCTHTELYSTMSLPMTPGEYRAKAGQFPPADRIRQITLDFVMTKIAEGPPISDEPKPAPAPAPTRRKRKGRFGHLEIEIEQVA